MDELTLHAAARTEPGSVRQALNFFFVPGEGSKSPLLKVMSLARCWCARRRR